MDPKVESGRGALELVELVESGGDARVLANVNPVSGGDGTLQSPDHGCGESNGRACSMGVSYLSPRGNRCAPLNPAELGAAVSGEG